MPRTFQPWLGVLQSPRFHRRLVLLWLALPLFIAGCIDGNVRSFVRYDAKEDTIWFLDVYTNLHAATKADLDYLASLWQRRDSILIKPLSGIHLTRDGSYELQAFTQEGIERIGKNQYRTIDLGSRAAKEPDIEVSRFRLDTIRVVPGQFYINEHGTLSCYHQMAVPGAVVDAVLEQIRPVIAQGVAKFENLEIEQAKKGEKRALWNEVRKAILEKLSDGGLPPVKATKKEDSGTLLPLEEETVRLLANTVADKSVKLRRIGSVIAVVLPVSKTDGAEAMATFELVSRTVADRLKAGKKVDDGLVAVLDAVQVRYVEGIGLEFSTNLCKLARIGHNAGNPKPDPKKTAYRATIEAMRARGIEIKADFSMESLVDEYTQ